MPGLTRGASIGRYIVLGLVGRGAMGEVYAAYDPELDRKVALKLLRPGKDGAAEAKSRLLREAQAMARLSHPNVIAVHDVGSFGDRVFVAMEFVNGYTVAYWLHAETRSWQEIVRVFLSAGRGLAAAHAANMVHRDFKAENVMLGRDGQVRVTDFGLARQLTGGGKERPRPAPAPAPVQIPLAAGDPDLDSTRPLPVQVGTAVGEILEVDAGAGDDDDILVRAASAGTGGLFAADIANDVLGAAGPGVGEAAEAGEGVATDDKAAADGAGARLSGSDRLAVNLTRTGFVMGTPAYMSPEVFCGRPGDACSDQFSFCVALYEALFRTHPFGGNTLTELTDNVLSGKLRPAPEGTRVPKWVRRALVRGMQLKPQDRWPSMDALLLALQRSPSRRGWVWVAATAAIGAAAVALSIARVTPRGPPACVVTSERFANVWEPSPAGARRLAIGQAMRSSRKSYAETSLAGLTRLLDRYVDNWSSMYKDVCEATNVRHEQSASVLDVRMSCLRDRWKELRALSDILVEGQAVAVTNAIAAASALTPIERCAEVGTVGAGPAPPPEGIRPRVEALRNRLVDTKALEDAGNYGRALEAAGGVLTEARALAYRPLVAEALNRFARLQLDTGQIGQADANFDEAVWIAEAASHDEMVALIATEQIFVSGYLQRDFARARRWTNHAQAVLDRIGGHDQIRAWMLNNVGVVADADGRHEEAAGRFFQALQIKEHLLGKDHPDVSYTLSNLADTLNVLGRSLEALDFINRATDIIQRTFGAGHPDMAPQLMNRAEILNQLGRPAEALRDAQSALAINEREFGPDFRNLVFALAPMGEAELALGHPQRAVEPLERAVELAAGSDLSAELPRLRFALARALWESGGDQRRARQLVTQVLAQRPPASASTPGESKEERLQRRAKAWLASHVEEGAAK